MTFHADLEYGQDYYQKVDVYAPLNVSEPLPVLLFVHGGAFIGGYKEWMGFMASAIVETPAVLVSVSYRLAPESPFPAAVEDVGDALAWTYHNIAGFGGDPERIFLGGHSAGGHLAALVALDASWLAAHDLGPAIIKGVIAVSAPLDMNFAGEGAGTEAALKMRRTFIPNDEDVIRANPIAQISDRAPPFYVSAGDDDLWSLAEDMKRFASALRDNDVPVIEEVFAGHNHFDTNMRCVDEGHPWIGRVTQFLRSGSPS